jgi:hypothetical protein
MLFGGAMATRCSLVLVGLLLAAAARGAESTATFRVGVRVVRPFAVHSPAAGSAATRVERGGARATSLARVVPPGTASGGAVLAGARGAIQLPCDARGCEVALSEAGGPTVLLTVFPDGAPVALVER